jgi:hypothetical protein
MGNWKWEGILALVLVSLILFGVILGQLHVTNPITMDSQSVLGIIISYIGNAVKNIFKGVFF